MSVVDATVVYNDKRFDARCEIVAEPGGKIKMTLTNVAVDPFFMSVKFGAEELMNGIDAAMEKKDPEDEN